jgi:uncharacterized membrane protein YiaA
MLFQVDWEARRNKMNKIGYLMITLGFLAGALVAVLDEQIVQWGYYFAAFLLGAVGITLVRIDQRRKTRSEEKLTSSMQNIESSLSRISENMNKLGTENKSLNPYDVRHRIDELFPGDLNTFVEARETISHVYGLQAYADVMSHFAAGERYLNRVWSASADGYIDEVRAYLEKASEQFLEALQRVRRLKVETS